MKAYVLATAFAASTLASPFATKIQKRAEHCEQYATEQTGGYTVYNNIWGLAQATNGSQCFSVTSLSSGVLAWQTTWSWEGDSSVKSYANAVLDSIVSSPKQISAISSLQSTWSWTNQATSVTANVAYDLFTSSTASGAEEFEIMLWLAALGGAGPISSTYGADGKPTAIATGLSIGGQSWNLYKGPNGDMTVYSFVASSTVASFSGDLKDFFTYLVSDQAFSTSQYLKSVGAGTEAFTGSDVVFTTSAYSLTIA